MANVILELHITCRCCGEEHKISVPMNAYHEWRQGHRMIQDALPSLTVDERELLLSGICGVCFDKTFAEDD